MKLSVDDGVGYSVYNVWRITTVDGASIFILAALTTWNETKITNRCANNTLKFLKSEV